MPAEASRASRTQSGVFENAVTEYVSPSYFDLVGARAAAGRFFNDSDDAVVVITEAYRRRIFGTAIGIGESQVRLGPGDGNRHRGGRF